MTLFILRFLTFTIYLTLFHTGVLLMQFMEDFHAHPIENPKKLQIGKQENYIFPGVLDSAHCATETRVY